MKTKKLSIALATLLALCGTGRVMADTLLDTTGGNIFVLGTGYDVENYPTAKQAIGLRFSVGSDNLVTGVEAYMNIAGGNAVTLGLMADSSGVPSNSFIAGDSVHLTTGLPVNLISLNWSVTPGDTYWLVAIADFTGDTTRNDVNWNAFAPANAWDFTVGQTTDNWGTAQQFEAPAAIITGDSSTATPLPPTLPLLVGGLGGLGLLGWRRKKRKAQAV